MTPLEKLVVKLTADAQQFDATMKATQAKLVAFNQSVGGTNQAMKENSMVSSAWATAMRVGPYAAITALLKVGLDYSNQLDDISDRTGLAASKVQLLQRAAIEAGVGGEALVGALERMTRNIGQAATGSEQAQQAIAGLGIRLDELVGKEPDQQMQLIARALASIQDPAERAARATEIFGKGSTKLLELLKDFDGATKAAAEGMLFAGSTVDAASDMVQRGNRAWGSLWDTIKTGAMIAAGATAEAGLVISGQIKDIVAGTEHHAAASEQAGERIGGALDEERVKREAIRVALERERAAAEAAKKAQEEYILSINQQLGMLIDTMNKEADAALSPLDAEEKAYKKRIELAKQYGQLGPMEAHRSLGIIEDAEKAHQAKVFAIMNDGLEDKLNAEKANIEARRNLQDEKAIADIAAFENVRAQIRQESLEREGALAVEMETYNQRKQAIMTHYADQGEVTAGGKRLLEDLEAGHQATITDIDANNLDKRKSLEVSALNAKMDLNRMILGNLATLMQSSNKKMFEFGKIAAIGEAVVNTYLGATKALATVPYPFNFAAAASVTAAGLMNVQKISSTQFGGGGGAAGGGSPGGSSSPASGNGEAYSGPNSGANTNGAGNRTVTINIADGIHSKETVRQLAEQLGEYTRDGGTALKVN